MTHLTYSDRAEVLALVVGAVMGASTLRAVDPERLSSLVSWGKPNPRKVPTVRRTGSEGRRRGSDPYGDVMARARMRRLLWELERDRPVTAAFVKGAAFGTSLNGTLEGLKAAGIPFHRRDLHLAPAMVDDGLAWLWERWA